jgi:formylmethanofuran dehydrogenase subunit D
MKLKVTLLTGRTIEQGVAKEHGKTSEAYAESAAVCYVNSEDLKQLGIREKTNVMVSTKNGSVVVRALKSQRCIRRGVVFIPYGPWSNGVTDSRTDSLGMPSFKGTPAEIESAADKPVLDLRKLLKEQFGKE